MVLYVRNILYNHSGLIYQSKGNSKMKNLPNISDNVYISCNKLKIMKCKIITNFIIGREEKSDICCCNIIKYLTFLKSEWIKFT